MFSYHMEVIEEERQDSPPALNYTHKILPGVSALENYGYVYYPFFKNDFLPLQVISVCFLL